MTTYASFALPLILLASVQGCSNDSPASREGSALTADAAGQQANEADTAAPDGEGWMSSTCTPLLSSQELWQLVDSGSYDLYVLNGLKIVGDQAIEERTETGVLESRALLVSLEGADLVVDITGTRPEHALLFLEHSRVFRSDEGGVFHERACTAARSVEDGGSLSSRVIAGSDRNVLLLVQATRQLGPVVRQVAVVVGQSVHLAGQEEVPLAAILEAASAARRTR